MTSQAAVAAPGRALEQLTVAVLGCGRMGSGMATSLGHKGARLVLYNRTADRATQLAARIGGEVAATPADAVRNADVVISMVADDAAVADLFRGPDGALLALRSGAVAVEMSTITPRVILELAPDIRARGAGILDAPVSGSVQFAESGQLTVMVGGDDADLERARPVLEAIGQKVIHVGSLGAGKTVKLAVNAVIFGINGSLSEALVLAERAGVRRDVIYQVIADSAAGAPFVKYKTQAFLEPDTTSAAFTLGLTEKDLRLILELARSAGAEMPHSAAALEVVNEAMAELGPDVDLSGVARFLRAGRTGMA